MVTRLKGMSLSGLQKVKATIKADYPAALVDISENKFQIKLRALSKDAFTQLLSKLEDSTPSEAEQSTNTQPHTEDLELSAKNTKT